MKNKYTIGIGLNLFDARAVLLRQDGKIMAEIERKRGKISVNEVIEDLLKLFEAILSKTKKYKESISGVGVALGGIINSKKGEVYWPQQSGTSYVYTSLPLKDYLQKKFGFPVVLENDANACVWAEHLTNYPKNKNIVYMFSGVGAGIIANGTLYRGKNGKAGELFLNPRKAMSTSLGDFSFLGQWPADLRMVERAKSLISMGEESSLIKRITSTGELVLEAIFEEAKKKDRVARQIIREAAFSLGVKIAFIVNFINPELIIIGGGMEDAGELMLEECSNAVKNFCMSEMRKNLKICLSKLGKQGTSVGAALLSFREKTLHD
ncbi:MAG: ROK family protein [Candidatus Omnitrophota bacterium]|nr:MAG: ROK family protein [Candidatus Omnitrophota bacterium]